MKSRAEVYKRWCRIDNELAHGGLHVRTFAAREGVSRKTIWRDLAAFRARGLPVGQYYTAMGKDGIDQRYRVWQYPASLRLGEEARLKRLR